MDVPTEVQRFVCGTETHAVRLPRSFTVREELATAWLAAADAEDVMRLRRVAAATLALASRVSERLTAAKVKPYDGDVLGYGAAAYDYLHDQGMAAPAIIEAASSIMKAVLENLYPREVELREAAGFSGPNVAEPT